MQRAMCAFHRFTAASIVCLLVGPAAMGAESAPVSLAAPHGEHGKIDLLNGEDFISYEFVAAPGAAHTPAVFKVFRPRPDPPEGLPQPHIEAGNVGSWAFIGEGPQAFMSAMMNLDANGIVTWTFMTPDKLEKYRPTAPAQVKSPIPVAGGGPPGWKARDANFPPYDLAWVSLATNEMGARTLKYNYSDGGGQPFQIWGDVANRNIQFSYLGFNDEGTWLTAVDLDPKRLFVLKGAVLTRKPYSTPLPKNLRNSSDDVQAYYSGKFGNGPTAEQESAQNDRIQKLVAVDEQLSAVQHQVMQELWQSGYADPNQKVLDRKQADKNYGAWRGQAQQDCGFASSGSPAPLRVWGNALVKTDAIYNCLMEKTLGRISLYQRFHDEFAARGASAESLAAIGISRTERRSDSN